MTPEEIARSSRLVMAAYNELLQTAAGLENAAYRQLMNEVLETPRVTFLEQFPTSVDRQKMFDDMVKRGYFNAEDTPDYVWPPNHLSPQSYLTSPQSHPDWYNAHPGGMALTVAFNVRIANAHTENYRQLYGLPLNRDLPAAALCIHEYPKAWLYQWQDNGYWLDEPRSMDGDSIHTHCIYVTAELMYRGYDPALTMAVATAHALSTIELTVSGRHTGLTLTGPDFVVRFIEAAAVLAQKDPVQYGLLERHKGKHVLATLPAEQWITHLADMNWPYTQGVANPHTLAFLQSVAQQDYGLSDKEVAAPPYSRPFNQLKSYVWAQLGQIPLYEILQREGYEAARATVQRLISR